MSFLLALLMGMVHGLTVFLPVSSSGHLTILENIFCLDSSDGSIMLFKAMLNLSTLAAIVITYRRELKLMAIETVLVLSGNSRGGRDESGRKLHKFRLTLLVVIASLPLFVVIPFRGYINELFSNVTFVAFALLITGVLIYITDRIRPGKKKEKNLNILDAVLIGITQAISVIPGLSRSGSTIFIGKLRGMKRNIAVKFSFLVLIPAAFGAFVFELISAFKAGIVWGMVPKFLVGMIAAVVFGYLAIILVKMLVNKARFRWLAYYCWIIGAITFVISLFNYI